VLLAIVVVPVAIFSTNMPKISIELAIQQFSIRKCFVVPVMEIPLVVEPVIFQSAMI
jgi:hypothetical protein